MHGTTFRSTILCFRAAQFSHKMASLQFARDAGGVTRLFIEIRDSKNWATVSKAEGIW
jgi:hypothetical protein